MARRKRTEVASTTSSIRSASPAITSSHTQATHETPRKKYKNKKGISKASDYFSDSPYRGKGHVTPSESDSDETKALKPRSLIFSRKRRRRSTAERNTKDPFECLGDDVVGIIITHLPAITTEILRRVSKHWKLLSEYHNGNEALQRYFGHVEQRKPEYTNREEANLRFRRRCKFYDIILGVRLSGIRQPSEEMIFGSYYQLLSTISDRGTIPSSFIS